MARRDKVTEPVADNKRAALKETHRTQQGSRSAGPSRAHSMKEGRSEKKGGTAPKQGGRRP